MINSLVIFEHLDANGLIRFNDLMLNYAKSATARPGDRQNGFKNGTNLLFNSRGVGK